MEEALKQNGMADYIGSVRFPLERMLRENKFVGRPEIRNLDKEVMGYAEIELKYVDADSAEALSLLNEDRDTAYKS
jgi:hypothetical protein